MANLFDPLNVGHLTLKNRIVMPPMANELAGPAGEVTDALVAHYKRRAAGVGLVIVEHSYVASDGKSSPRQLGIHDDTLIKGLANLAEAIHEEGTPACIQINHAGRRARRSICGSQPVGPSAIVAKASDEIPRELERHEIQRFVTLFVEAARRARKAGFDAVEMHGAHGFLLNQFTSPLSNRRTDEYGGSFESRIRFPIEVVEEAGKAIGSDFPLLYRLGADDGREGGVTIGESQVFAQRLVQAGVKIVDVSGGLVGDAPEGIASSQGYFLPLAEKIKQAVGVPVIGVGGITDPSFADDAIKRDRVDLVAVGRALLTNPDWALTAAKSLGLRGL